MPKLSICIPTMNRAAVIAETLEAIAVECQHADTELVILDSSPDDQTEQVVRRYQDRLPVLTYRRQPPAGGDQDFSNIVSLARGEYCWFLTDDDLLLPGSDQAVRLALDGNPDCVFLNHSLRDHRMEEELIPNFLGYEETRTRAPGEFNRFASDSLHGAAYIGAFVVRRTLWLERESLGAPYYGTDFAHVVRLYAKPMEGSTVVIGRPCVAIRLGVSLWVSRGFRVWAISWPEIIWTLPGVDDATRERTTPREPWRNLSMLVRMRAIGSFTVADYNRWLKPQRMPVRLRFIAWLLCHLPARLINFLARTYLRLFLPDRRFFLAELNGATATRKIRRTA